MKRLPDIAHEHIERNTIIRERLPDPARRIEYEIGDSKQDDFYPQFKTKHWDNEANFSIRLKDTNYEADDIKVKSGKVEWKKGTKTARLYELDGFEDGGFEFEVEFAQKPDSNVIEYTIQSKEFDFFYQPPLTPEEIAEGAQRPENVIGSYAVYHKSKAHNRVGGKHYRTGKAFHIYRPFAEDAEGKREWCDLNIEGDLLTVTVPQKFLDEAVYPVRVDPTFGYTSVGATDFLILCNRGGTTFTHNRTGNKYTFADSGTLDSISVNARHSSTTETVTMRVAINTADSEGTNSHGEIAGKSEDKSFTTSFEWHTFTTAGESLSPNNYIINTIADARDFAATFRSIYVAADDNSFPLYTKQATGNGYDTLSVENPWTTNAPSNSWQYSIYATYTASGPATLTSTHTLNALKNVRATATHTLNSLLFSRATASHTLDAFTQIRAALTHSLDAFLRAVRTTTHSIDALLRLENTSTHSLDTLTSTDGGTLDTDLWEVSFGGEFQEHTVDSLLKTRHTADHSVDSLLKERRIVTDVVKTDSFENTGGASTIDVGGERFVTQVGQAITAVSGRLHSAAFFLRQSGSPTGVAYAKLYASTGTFGVDAVPTGAALATSDPRDVSAFSGSFQYETFTFSGEDRIQLAPNTNYILVFEYTGGDTNNYVVAQYRINLNATHSGNYSHNHDGSWIAFSNRDLIFRLFQEPDTTFDALLYARPTVVHSLDALLAHENTDTHTLNSLLKTRATATHSLDALLTQRLTAAHTADALLFARQTATHSLDALRLATVALAHTLDANLRAVLTADHSLDALLRQQLTAQHTLDSHLLTRNTLTHSLDSFLWVRATATHTLDALLWAVQTRDHNLDSLLRARLTALHTISAVLNAAGQSIHSIDTLKRAILTSSHTLDSYAVYRQSAEHSADALKFARATKAHTLDAATYTRPASIHSLDTLLRSDNAATHSVNTLLRKTLTALHTLDAFATLRQAAAHTLDTLLKRRASESHTLDTRRIRRDSATHTISALKVERQSVAHSLDTLLKKSETPEHSLDAHLNPSVSHRIDAILDRRLTNPYAKKPPIYTPKPPPFARKPRIYTPKPSPHAPKKSPYTVL